MAVSKVIIGIDEVGRGALAGPVVVAAAMIAGRLPGRLKDSKKLSAKAREVWYAYFLNHPKISFAVAKVHPRQIEKRNISCAANLAALRAYKKLSAKAPTPIFLDGGLYLGSRKWQTTNVPRAKTVIKGDETIAAVAIASIVAKVVRDRLMVGLVKKYPEYSFGMHKGYGTKIHLAAIQKHGPSAVHRLTFLKNTSKV